MARSTGKSIVVTLSADALARLEHLVRAGAYETVDEVVNDAVAHWLTDRKPEITPIAAPPEPVFVLAANMQDILRGAAQPLAALE